MTEILLIASITLLLIAIVLIWFRNPHNPALAYLQAQVANLQTTVDKLESGLKEDFRINRIESADQAKANRQELKPYTDLKPSKHKRLRRLPRKTDKR
jgi:hypothetical protein